MTEKEERELKLAFDLFDLTGKGLIDKDDALKIMVTLGFKVGKEDA